MTYKIYTENSTRLIDAPTIEDALTIFKQTSEAEVIAVANMGKGNEAATWVSVKDSGFKKEGGNILVTDGEFIMLAFYWPHSGLLQFIEKDEYWKKENITHWMPLPAAPKQK